MAAKIFDDNNNLKGYSINIDGKEVIIPPDQARDIYDTLQTDYRREAVISELEYRDDIEIPADKKERVVSEILDIYEIKLERGAQPCGETLDEAINEVI